MLQFAVKKVQNKNPTCENQLYFNQNVPFSPLSHSFGGKDISKEYTIWINAHQAYTLGFHKGTSRHCIVWLTPKG